MAYVEVNGLRTWHEVRGEGHPVVLLHGAFADAASWSGQAPVLTDAGFRVHVPERRGHGHTPDAPGPLTYEVMADDTVAYVGRVVGGPAHLVGWSDGAVVALLVARRRPELVDRMVLIGQYFNSSGKVAGGLGDQLRAGGDRAAPRAARGSSRHAHPAPGEPGRRQRAAPVVPRRGDPGSRTPSDHVEQGAVTMKAAVVHVPGQPPRYESFPDPVPREHETAVQVTAAGLHPIVKTLADGSHYGSTNRLPMVPARAAGGEFRIGVEPVPLAEVRDAWRRDQHGRRLVLIP